MKKAWAAKNGFTIIELLVSIVVIGILVAIMIVSYTGIQQRSRDSERSGDVTQIKIAIEKYHAEKSKYPDVCPGGIDSECSVTYLVTELQPYLATMPHDPRNALDSADDYRYIRGADALDNYAIRVAYEARDVCKTGTNITTTWWSSIPSC